MKLASSQLARRVFRFGFLVLAARSIEVGSFGGYAVVFTVTEMIALFSGTAYTDFLTREAARDTDLAAQLVLQVIRIRCAYLVPLLFLEIVTIAMLHLRAWLPVAILLSVTLFARSITEAVQGALRARGRLDAFLGIEFAQGSALIVAGVLLLARSQAVIRLAIAEVLAGAVGAAIASLLLVRMYNGIFKRIPLKGLMRRALPFNFYPLIVNVYDRADLILLAKLVGGTAAGIYAVPYRAFASVQIIPYSLLGTLLPKLSRQYDFTGAQFRQVIGFLYLIALVAVSETTLFSNSIIHIALGSKYVESGTVLRILIWAIVPAFLNFALNTYLLATNQEKMFLYTASVCTVFNIVANIIFIPRYSYRAAAVVTILTECLLLIQNYVLVRRKLGEVPLPAHFGLFSIVFAIMFPSLFVVKGTPALLLGIVTLGLFAVACWSLSKERVAASPASA